MTNKIKYQIRKAKSSYLRIIEKQPSAKALLKAQEQIKKCEFALKEIDKGKLEPAFNILTEIITRRIRKRYIAESLIQDYKELGKRLGKDTVIVKLNTK